MPQAYFPPLDRCLAGEEHLISWKTAYRVLADNDNALEERTLEAFLTDAESLVYLANPLDPYPPRSAKTKGDFETKTAPINVSESSNGDYSLDELKKDAIWLSEKLNVEELIALRIVIIEWQQRSADELRVATNGTESLSPPNGSASALAVSRNGFGESANGSSALLNGSTTAIDFSKEEIRRERQLAIYLEERSYTATISANLASRAAIADETAKTRRTWLDTVAEKVVEVPNSTHATRDAYCTKVIETISDLVSKENDDSKWPEAFNANDTNRLVYSTAIVRDITAATRLLLANLHMLEAMPSSDVVKSWFEFVGHVKFFQDLVSSPSIPDPTALQTLVSTISLVVLKLPETLSRLRDTANQLSGQTEMLYPELPDDSYIRHGSCMKEVNLVLYRAARENVVLASSAIYAWGLIAILIRDIAHLQHETRTIEDGTDDGDQVYRRRASRREEGEELTLYERQLHVLQDFELEGDAREDPGVFFVRVAVDQMNVYSVMPQLCRIAAGAYGSGDELPTSFVLRSALYDLAREGVSIVSYGGEVLQSVLAILSPNATGASNKVDEYLSNRFACDEEVFRPATLDQAIARYPYELSPMLRLLTAFATTSNTHGQHRFDVVELLEGLQTFTIMVPEHFRAYTLDHEDENMNSMILTESLPLFISKQALSFYGSEYVGRAALTMGSGEFSGSNVLSIPSNSPGAVVKESRPMVLRIEHPHSGLEYLGLLLSTLLPNSELIAAPMDGRLDRTSAAEIISLVSALLQQCIQPELSIDEAQFILGRLSFALQDEQDIITIIGDIVEVELLAFLDQSTQDGSLDLAVACAEFFDKLTHVSPDRVWPTLAHSTLLGLSGGTSALPAVVAGTEVGLGRYRFLTACVDVYSNVIRDAIEGLVKRKSSVSKALNRFDSPISFQDTTPERTISTVLSAYQSVMIDAWQNLGEWRFTDPTEKTRVAISIMRSFSWLLRSTFGIGSGGECISSQLNPSATALLNALVPEGSNGSALEPFFAILSAGLLLGDDSLPSRQRQPLVQQTLEAIRLLLALIKTARLVDGTGHRARLFATQLVRGMPILASLLATENSLKYTICMLLGEIVQAINHAEVDPPSLLGQLSANAAKSFLSLISQLDSPIRDVDDESAIWDFLSAVMSCKQQWLAGFLLTGAIPRDRFKNRTDGNATPKSKSLLTFALGQLSRIAELAPERAVAMLRFVASSQSSWVLATNQVRAHRDFFNNSLDWLEQLKIPSRSSNIAEEQILTNEHEMAAYLCEVLAVNIQASNEIGDKTVLKMLSSKLSFLVNHGAAVNAYNRSLHHNLAGNFAGRFPACDLAELKKTSAQTRKFGRKYSYDLDLADQILDHESAWHGHRNGRSQGFSDEFARANINLSLVEAQRRLLKSWRLLATALCDCLDGDAALQGELARAAERCLNANVEANLDEPGMDDVIKIRANMGFVLISKLVSIKSADPAMKTLLPAAWSLVRASPVDFDIAMAPEDLSYYRTLLQVLYLSIQPHIYAASQSTRTGEPRATDETKVEYLDPTVAAILAQVMRRVIAPGFRALCGNLHSSIDLALPSDFALLTAVLQAILSVPGISAVHPQLAEVVASTSLIRSALSLYSWSDQLAEVLNQDPVYGEVAVMFLLSLSTIAPVAEQMALEGVLIQLSSANLSNYFRKAGGKTPFSEPRRMFVIWSEGFLPLCLNLLDAVGPPIAAEVSAFLDSFPQQLQRANNALENREATRQNPYANAITLGVVSEAHSLCLIALILASDTARGAAEGIDANDVPVLEYEYEKVRDDAAGLMRQKTSLASRVVPVGERDEAWSEGGAGMKGDNMLLAKTIKEVSGLLECFGREE